MTTEIFAKIGDIKGESLAAGHRDEIDVLSFSWGVANTGTTGAGGGSGAGRATFRDLVIVHHIDNATPGLILACATGRHLPQTTITHRIAGQREFLIIKLDDVTVTSVDHTGGEGQPYTESVSLRFAKVDLHYRKQRPDGTLDDGQHFTFDLKTHQPG
ncbi:type VI secretion system secreted protein Hcp [Mycobacterium frederiksbergense]|uniref:Type VI secretion system secreted protein Hcp n=1 Tax=Mycolicibacterium frederiksbergense TaxID=117567 RepID=A0ABT6KXQ1_9MYCO|nr:type VI secretion system tube protein Hcp [Mycolicibacterium frederiksbergense]MDH6195493.1 type VI secretion system secreted protein Hcp [Mycolicibacterium frederiksbergense]